MSFLSRIFSGLAKKTSRAAGHPITFAMAVAVVVAWAITGPIFHYSDTWQLVINSFTDIVTFLIVFLIQNTQNRDGQAVQIKLDELIRAAKGAHSVMLALEELSDDELREIKRQYADLARQARQRMRAGKSDTGRPPIDTSAAEDAT